jgi:formamidopyrimidine-DNA glycosylase
MPELPEVHTTATGLHKIAKGKRILDTWTSYNSAFHKGKNNIKNPEFFKKFQELTKNQKIIKVERRGKNILINLENNLTILIHLKMTGHLLYGKYGKQGKTWVALEDGPLKDDPYNKHIRFLFILDNDKHVALSDLRKFAKVTLYEKSDLDHLGPEPLDESFTFEKFTERLNLKHKGKIKTVLMDQEIIAGIGNIYSDEILWRVGVHPESITSKIPKKTLKEMHKAIKELLNKGIDFGGDSMSDYRNIEGKPGRFQGEHKVYQRAKEKCLKKGCNGNIVRKMVGARSAHFCNTHQQLFT